MTQIHYVRKHIKWANDQAVGAYTDIWATYN